MRARDIVIVKNFLEHFADVIDYIRRASIFNSNFVGVLILLTSLLTRLLARLLAITFTSILRYLLSRLFLSISFSLRPAFEHPPRDKEVLASPSTSR